MRNERPAAIVPGMVAIEGVLPVLRVLVVRVPGILGPHSGLFKGLISAMDGDFVNGFHQAARIDRLGQVLLEPDRQGFDPV
jgi:hypothetical protein